MAFRRKKDTYRGGEKTPNQAIHAKVAQWAINSDTLRRARRRNARQICIFNYDTGEFYWIATWKFTDGEFSKYRNYTDQGGTPQNFVLFEHFTKQPYLGMHRMRRRG